MFKSLAFWHLVPPNDRVHFCWDRHCQLILEELVSQLSSVNIKIINICCSKVQMVNKIYGHIDHMPRNTRSLNGFLFYAVVCFQYRYNTLRPRQHGCNFAEDISKRIFLNGPINTTPALVQIMAWRRPGDKPLSESVFVRLPTHICVARPEWVQWIQRLNVWIQVNNWQLATDKWHLAPMPLALVCL